MNPSPAIDPATMRQYRQLFGGHQQTLAPGGIGHNPMLHALLLARARRLRPQLSGQIQTPMTPHAVTGNLGSSTGPGIGDDTGDAG
jgi:hypothetical protein